MLYSIYIFQNAKEKIAIWVEEREWKEWGSGQKKGIGKKCSQYTFYRCIKWHNKI